MSTGPLTLFGIDTPAPRKRKCRLGWSCSDGLHYTLDGTGYVVAKQPHPTALWPYLPLAPDGEWILTPSGLAWANLAHAQEAAELHAEGKLTEDKKIEILSRRIK
jgi:hypothetical protein